MFDDGVLEPEMVSSECRLERLRREEDEVVDHHGSNIFYEGTNGCVEVVSCTLLGVS